MESHTLQAGMDGSKKAVKVSVLIIKANPMPFLNCIKIKAKMA